MMKMNEQKDKRMIVREKKKKKMFLGFVCMCNHIPVIAITHTCMYFSVSK